MDSSEIIARLIQHVLNAAQVSSHERVLLRRYSEDVSRNIVGHLLRESKEIEIGLPEDDGNTSVTTMPAYVAASGRVEVIPFVVTETPQTGDPAWVGSRGFASRLRTSFPLQVSAGVCRILIILDRRPVETQQTTISAELGDTIDSIETLFSWFTTGEWKNGFVPEVYQLAIRVLSWWKRRLKSDPPWNAAEHGVQLERAVAFLTACRGCATVPEIGDKLSILGLLFRDPNLTTTSSLETRLDRNSNIAAELEGVRLRRVLDPVVEADRILDLGTVGSEFHTNISAALRSLSSLVTEAAVSFGEIDARLRTNARRPAWLDFSKAVFSPLGPDGKAIGATLSWRLLSGELSQPDGTIEVLVSCPSDLLRLTVPVAGNLRAFLYNGDKLVSQSSEADGALIPPNEVVFDLAKPETFAVTELLIREQRTGTTRPSRPTQIVRLGIFAGSDIAVPNESFLDPEEQAFVVDGNSGSVKVQVGSMEVDVSAELPPEDGSATLVELNGVKFRWMGEDRSPSQEAPPPNRDVRLIELVGVRELGDPKSARPFFADGGRLSAACMTSAFLDVDEALMQQEAALLKNPQQFVGIGGDNAAALHELKRLAGPQTDAWLRDRERFFSEVTNACQAALGDVGASRPSMYLTDLRNPALGDLAARYVDSYSALLEKAAQAAHIAANRAVIEPLLMCDRGVTADDSLTLAPTHPLAVSLLATLQRGLLSKAWDETSDRYAIEELLRRPLLSGVLPWVPWRGAVLTAASACPLLWRCYGSEGASVDTSDELGPVIIQKVKRFLDLSPYINAPGQRLYINVEIGRGAGRYVLRALHELERDAGIACSFDVGIVCLDDRVIPDLIAVFEAGSRQRSDTQRDRLHGFVRVCRLTTIASRQAHLVFRMESASSEKQPFSNLSETHTVVRETGFSGGLSYEPARFAVTTPNEVVYTRYVFAGEDDRSMGSEPPEGLWDGVWRRRYRHLCRLTQRAAVGLHSGIGQSTIPCETLRQIAAKESVDEYASSFITVHCDPAQGPEFFVGPRTTRSGVFLVECSDRGSPELPGRDIVSVTSRIGPFRAALTAAVSSLPSPLREIVDDTVAKGLLRDINMLRGTEVFDFFKEVARSGNHIYIMDGLDNVMALRYLLSDEAAVADHIPVVASMNDLTLRCAALSDLRKGTKCDDILVLYIPIKASVRVIQYRLVEVKFGQRNQQWSKAQKQLSETSLKLSERIPVGRWSESNSPAMLLLERDIAWTIHEGLERYRAFGLMDDGQHKEKTSVLRQLFRDLHRGDFELRPFGYGSSASPLCGTALMFDPHIPGGDVEIRVEQAVEYITIPRDRIQILLSEPVHGIGGLLPGDEGADGVFQSPRVPDTPISPVASGQSLQNPKVSAVTPEEPGSRHSPSDFFDDASNELPAAENTATHVSCGDTRREEAIGRVEKVFAGFVGNTGPVTRLKRTLTIASLEGKAFLEPIGLFGPKSTGKTELARRIALVLDVPKAELSETLLRSAEDLAEKIRVTASGAKLPMRTEVDQNGGAVLRAPPMVVFIDEVHLLRRGVQDSLLKALEPDDRTLLSTIGTIDTRQVTFIIATTDPGNLGDAFKSRISRYELREYSLEEVVEILIAHRTHKELPNEARLFDVEALRLIARIGRLVPRQALRMLRDVSREVAVGFVKADTATLKSHFWEQFRTDDMGLNDRDRTYMRALFPDKTMGLDALAALLGEGKSNISVDIEPYLLRLGLIERARDGRNLTNAGRELVPRLAK